jgi:uncharacterized short protein YbdD (DUF466 family)
MGAAPAAAQQRGPVLGGASTVRRWARALRWYVRSVMGDDAYDRYRAHYLSAHPGGTPVGRTGSDGGGRGSMMTEREFWRDRTDRQDTQPQGRCC